MAQTNWDVEVGGSLLNPNNLPYYAPQDLVIEVGDMVTWTNVGGSHNVYGELDEYPNNPVGFSNGPNPITNPWIFPYTFTVPGVYGYLCTGEFNGMFHSTTQFGTITVIDASSITESSPWGELSLYPVPANKVLNIATNTNERLTLEVVAPDGRLVRTTKTNGNGPTQLDLDELAPGRYVLRLIDTQGRSMARAFVKN